MESPDEQFKLNERADQCANFLVRMAAGIKQSSPCYWDDLDSIIEQNIKDDDEAKRVVDSLMEFGSDIHVGHGFDPWDTAEEVAIRIMGNRDLRFNEAAPSRLTITAAGPNKLQVIDVLRVRLNLSEQAAQDIVQGQGTIYVPKGRDAFTMRLQLEAFGATVEWQR